MPISRVTFLLPTIKIIITKLSQCYNKITLNNQRVFFHNKICNERREENVVALFIAIVKSDSYRKLSESKSMSRPLHLDLPWCCRKREWLKIKEEGHIIFILEFELSRRVLDVRYTGCRECSNDRKAHGRADVYVYIRTYPRLDRPQNRLVWIFYIRSDLFALCSLVSHRVF